VLVPLMIPDVYLPTYIPPVCNTLQHTATTATHCKTLHQLIPVVARDCDKVVLACTLAWFDAAMRNVGVGVTYCIAIHPVC